MALGRSYADCAFTNKADFTALASFNSEASLLAGQKQQPFVPAGFLANADASGKLLVLRAAGVVGCTGTPTYTFKVRLGSTAGDSTLTGGVLGTSAAITMQSGVTNKPWELTLRMRCTTPGVGSNNLTITGYGFVKSPSGFASPFEYVLEPTAPDTATWTAALFDGSVMNWFNLSVVCSASDPLNTITCKSLELWSGN